MDGSLTADPSSALEKEETVDKLGREIMRSLPF